SGRGTDESDAGPLTGLRQSGVFGQKPVAGMDRIDTLLLSQRKDALHVQICLNGPLSLSNLVSFIRLETMQTEPIFFGIDGYRSQPQLSGRSHNANGNFTAIEGEKLFHVWPLLIDSPQSSATLAPTPS